MRCTENLHSQTFIWTLAKNLHPSYMQAVLFKPSCTGSELLVTRKICMPSWIFSLYIFRQNSHSNQQILWTRNPHERWTACRENSASVIFYRLRVWPSTTLTTQEIKYVGLPNKNIYNFPTHCERACMCVFMHVHNVRVPTIYTTKEHIYSSKVQHVLATHQHPTTWWYKIPDESS